MKPQTIQPTLFPLDPPEAKPRLPAPPAPVTAQPQPPPSFEPRPGQVAFIEAACSTDENLVLWADPNAGKTIAVLAATMPALEDGRRVYVITPRTSLILQGAEDARRIFDFKERIAEVIGPPTKRIRLYANPEKQLLLVTPEAFLNDLLSGTVSIDSKDVVCFDEAHLLLQGKEAQDGSRKNAPSRIADWIRKLPAPPRILAYSATPAADETQLQELLGRLGARRFFRMESIKEMPAHAVCKVRLDSDPQLVQAKEWIEQAARAQAEAMLKRLVEAGERWAGCSDLRGLFGEVCAAAADISAPGRVFNMPSQKALQSLEDQFDKTKEAIKQHGDSFAKPEHLRRYLTFFGYAYSRWCAVQSLWHRWTELASVSRYSFSRAMAERLIEVNIPPSGKKDSRLFQRDLYTVTRSWFAEDRPPDSRNSNELLGRAFMLIAKGTPAENIARAGSWDKLWAKLFPGQEPGALKPPQQLKKALGVLEDFLLKSLRRDHPKWEFFGPDLRGRLSRSQDGKVIVFTPLASHALFLARQISEGYFGARAVALVGREHMSDRQCNLNIEALRNGALIDGLPVRVGVATTKVNLGLHVQGTDWVAIWGPPNTYHEFLQQIGRNTPQKGPGYAVSYQALDTQDEPRLWANTGKARKMKRRLSGHGDLLFPPERID